LVILVLLLTVPFQAAWGATGLLCAAASHHESNTAVAPHGHNGAHGGDHHHATGHEVPAASADPDTTAESGSHGTQGAAGKCKTCIECCSAAAPVPAETPSAFRPDIPQRVSSTVEPAMVLRAGDGLFRPPRTRSV
jgi:hypothetical protein